ncbi:MAG TPA: FAD-dependent oxidoreductase, partial [Candidatus Ozemobacteraceae bacterium]|nr:FAD-dependent oxidoreductase [Candidatus Ozemobacteraceae bacterium]
IEKIVMTPVQKFAERNIEVRLGVKAESVDAKARTVRLDNGETIGWDTLLLATGCDAFMPPIQGRERCGNLFVLREAADAEAIRAAATGKRRAVCIGGGVLGLEAAYHLTKLGLAVELVELAPRLMPRQLDAAGATVLQGLLEKQGFRFHLGAKLDCLGDGHLKLQGGDALDGDVYVVSAGVAPRLGLRNSSASNAAGEFGSMRLAGRTSTAFSPRETTSSMREGCGAPGSPLVTGETAPGRAWRGRPLPWACRLKASV